MNVTFSDFLDLDIQFCYCDVVQVGDAEEQAYFSDCGFDVNSQSMDWRLVRRPVISADKQFQCDYHGCGKSYYERKNLLQHQYLKHGRKKVLRR